MGTFNGFKCDNCGEEFRSGDRKYCPVAIQIRIDFGKTIPSSVCSTNRHVVWCRECVMSRGFHNPVTDEDKKIASENVLPFEEQFAILIEEMGFVRE